MKKNFISHLLQTGCIFSIACLTACGPVHRFTRVKNVPREYVRNYSVEGVKAPRSLSLFKRNPWIVFAKEQGTSYLSPSGKNEMQAVEYMDAFLVIKRKGDWLKLIQYNPAILKNGKLKEWKQAQYCGWMNQNDLLLTRSGFTDVLTGFKNKQVVMLSDTVALANPSAYFTNDSVKLFENTDLTQEAEADRWIRTSPESFCNTTDKKILSQVLNNYDQETTDFYRWKVEYTQDELSALILKRSGVDYGRIIDLVPVARGTSGRLWKLKIVGTKKTRTIGKELEIRRTLSPSHLYSSAFVIDRAELSAEGIPGRFILTGAGWGHGVGLCQIGAAVMGEQGYQYDAILLHYYIGANIEKLYE